MGKTSIEWTDASWNPIVGCSPVSPGCANCYAERLAATRLKNHPDYKGLSERPEGCYARWNGQVRFLPERLDEPQRWKKPKRIFVCDMGDLFHESVKDEWIARIVKVMLWCPQHTFQILTKRADRMRQVMSGFVEYSTPFKGKPLPNVWLGVSAENQHFADERIPLLLETPAAVRWISAEPLLGPVTGIGTRDFGGINWVVCGGESGANARPMHPDWARSLRDQCQAAGVPFFFKQWGQWLPVGQGMWSPGEAKAYAAWNWMNCEMVKVGKKAAGRQLDGREWNEFPTGRWAPAAGHWGQP
jgi:protein gp37